MAQNATFQRRASRGYLGLAVFLWVVIFLIVLACLFKGYVHASVYQDYATGAEAWWLRDAGGGVKVIHFGGVKLIHPYVQWSPSDSNAFCPLLPW